MEGQMSISQEKYFLTPGEVTVLLNLKLLLKAVAKNCGTRLTMVYSHRSMNNVNKNGHVGNEAEF